MTQPGIQDVVAHWYKLLEDFETSPIEFYAAVGEALDRRKLPSLKRSTVTFAEGGILAPQRTYLRVSGDRHHFDMCAAPFGTGFLFSAWVTQRRVRFVPVYLLFCAAVAFVVGWTLHRGLDWLWQSSYDFRLFFAPLRILLSWFCLAPLSAIAVLWSVNLLARVGIPEWELAILQVPLIGWAYASLFAPPTYYRADTMLAFQSSVHAAMMETIDRVTAQKGVRGLSEDERKPIFHRLT